MKHYFTKLPRPIKALLASIGFTASLIIFATTMGMVCQWVEATFGREAMQYTMLFLFFGTMSYFPIYFIWFDEKKKEDGETKNG